MTKPSLFRSRPSVSRRAVSTSTSSRSPVVIANSHVAISVALRDYRQSKRRDGVVETQRRDLPPQFKERLKGFGELRTKAALRSLIQARAQGVVSVTGG